MSPKDGTLGQAITFTYDAADRAVVADPALVLPPVASALPALALSFTGVGGEIPISSIQQINSHPFSGVPTVGDFQLALQASTADPGLLAAFAGGQQLGDAILHLRDATSKEYITYTLINPSITSLNTASSGDVPSESLSLHFDELQEKMPPPDPNSQAVVADVNLATISRLTPTPLILPPLGTTPQLGLSFVGFNKGELTLDSLQENVTWSNGVPSFSDFAVALPASVADPCLLIATLLGSRGPTDPIILHIRNATGQEYLTYTILNPSFTELETTTNGGIPSDVLGIHFTQLTEQVRPVNADGSLGNPVTFTYDTTDHTTLAAPDIIVPAIQTSIVSDSFSVNNPVPILTSLGQSFVNEGSSALSLQVTGSGFVAGATVQLGGTALTTTFVSGTQLTAMVPVAFLADQGVLAITVANPIPGGGTSAALTLAVLNVPPTANLTGPTGGVPGQPRTFTLLATDPSPVDQQAGFTFTINWGDGSPIQTVVGPSGIPVSHIFTQPQTDSTGMVIPYLVQLTATDKDEAVGPTATLGVLVQTAQLQGSTLAVGGTTGKDRIMLHPTDATGNILVMVNNQSQGIFHPTGQILLYAQAGDDVVRLESRVIHGKTYSITVPGIVYGGDGNDVLDSSGSSAANILLGGAGNDVLLGGSGPTVLIGGSGRDELFAGGGDTILMGGTTDYDPGSTTLTPAQQLLALDALLAEWGRTDLGGTLSQTYLHRVNDLLGPTKGGTAGGLNGSFFLNAATVHPDREKDALFGGGQGLNWFFGDAVGKDLLLRHRSGERITQE